MVTKEEKIVKKAVAPWKGRVTKDWFEDIEQQAWLIVLERLDKNPTEEFKETALRTRDTLNRWYNTKALPTVEKVKAITTNQDENGNTEERNVVFVDIDQFVDGDADMPQSLIVNDDTEDKDTLRKLLWDTDLTFKEDVVIRLTLAGKKQDEVAEIVGVSQARVSQLYDQGVAKMQQQLSMGK
jgi:RNA polymerase sigma factor (sigma-70 family)